jgi:excisionase family DNA binding protein
MQNTDNVFSPPLLLNIPQVAKIMCLGRTKVYELIATEGLPVVRFGRAVRISPAALQQWLEQRGNGKQSVA